ncbi:hypothetical protein ES044_17380 [Polaribacter sp. IC066]|uniref:Eco57I restriction-modification methylase domain-containing protein n=1 Tax=Polaribacter sp. IC066 TaxID=57032 RepID=UPI0011BDAF7D|nr:TaqI-like C-terminal specificity domain-containing protein [Polaribacter sp. IC066]TXD56117.1 hypothetical protein ES044_17380 [Polaribacter sp. IC066]
MSKINSLIEDFSTTNLIAFLRASIPSFKPDDDELDHLFQEDVYDKYESIIKIGEAEIDKDELIVIASKTNEPLTERTGKKNQYEIAKTILKHEVKDASLFIFYDDEGNFRFSFVKANYLGTKRNFTDFKRYTYFVTPSQTNKTFIKQIGGCNFNSLDEIIQAFSVEPLNKQFYQDIAKSFYGLIGGKVKIGSRNIEFDTALNLPSTPVETNRKIYQEFAVRLIGRTIFCWFLKSKKSENSIPLVPESWLSSKTVVETNNEQHNYYHSVLEKLFFLVLNKKQEDRKDYQLPKDQELIPFLNGGLFEAQTDDFFPTNSNGIHQIAYNLDIPNQWFIKLFEVLEQYNFTIDENSIYDAEVSIDPEMLGTIFENLLAEIDPDTEKSARKATGSFYTPREIVDYMVEQSLVQYLKTKIATDNEEQLLELFKEGGENKFEKSETKNILEALSDVKILDPACGSGAFPMGALHKIIIALQKLDPDASWWKKKQIANVPNALAKQMLKEKLDGESADYVRKLGVIQNSIYGVDIQPIASEISKLRSFLSLVIDETIIDKAENRGIQALPNLEFKFITANTLIGLPDEENQQFGLFDNYEELEQLKQLRAEYLQSHGNKKLKIKERFLKVQKKAFKKDSNLFTDVNSRSFLLTSWNPFKNEQSTWFDPEWMFGIEKFDIVIGNPPYGVSVKGDFRKKVLSQLSKVPDYEIYYFFIEVSKKFIGSNGITTYIIPNTFLFNVYAQKYRTQMLEDWKCFIIDCTAFKIFDKATVLNSIVLLEKSSSEKIKYFKTKNKNSFNLLTMQKADFMGIEELQEYKQNWGLAFKLDKSIIELTTKIKRVSEPLISLFPEISQGLIAYDKYQGQDEKTIKNRIYHYDNFAKSDLKKWLWGEDVTKYNLEWNKSEWLDYCDGIANPRDPKFFTGERILIREITNPSIFATITDEEYYHDPAIIIIKKSNNYSSKLLLAFLNSRIATFFHFNYSPKASKGAFPKIIVEDIRNFPLPKAEIKHIEKIEFLIDNIINEKKNKSEISEYSLKLDMIFFNIYELTYEEVKIIDPELKLTKEEYTNYQIN